MSEPATRLETRDERNARVVAGTTGQNHEALATALVAEFAEELGGTPVFAEGELYVPDGVIWRPMHPRELRNEIARRYGAFKAAATQRQISGIAERVADKCHQPEFFADAPDGVADAESFWTLRDGELVKVELSLEHRARFRLPVAAAFDEDGAPAPCPELRRFLDQTFAGDDCGALVDFVQEIFGAALFGLLAKLQRVVLLVGVTRAGKGTLARLLEALFPPAAICSVAPERWGHEYHLAALAGRALNLVGEVNEDRPIPGGPFKSASGGDLLGARHPNHASFSFRPRCAHVFSGNAFPPATDRDASFYVRWLVVPFRHSVAGGEDPELADQLVRTGLRAILAWALLGAERLARRGRFDPPSAHIELLKRWRVEHSSVLTWLSDPDAVKLDRDCREPRARAYEAWRAWCKANEKRVFSSTKFYDEIERSGASLGVSQLKDKDGNRLLVGLRIVHAGILAGDD